MTRPEQKSKELQYARCASNLLNAAWTIEIPPDEEEWPDFKCKTNETEFGLEVTEVFLDEHKKGGSKSKKNEGNNSKTIADLAESYYSHVSAVPIMVHLLGDIIQTDKLLATLLDNISEFSDNDTKRFSPYQDCKLYVRQLPSEPKFDKYHHWIYVSDKVGWVANVGIKFLESKIMNKAKKLEKYSQNIDDIRLLLVSNRINNSGKAIPVENACCEKHGFTEVYYLSYPESLTNLGS